MSRKVSILFVDDEPNILRAVRRHVYSYRDRWDMHFAYGGVDAVKVITRETVDIIITDMRMPEVDGSRLLEWISEHHPQIIRIVLSGEAKLDEIYRIVGRSHRFLAKPCSPGAIISVIKDVVDARLHDQLENGTIELSMLDRLNTPSSLSNELQLALQADAPSCEEVAAIARKDPSLTLRLLQLSNSAYFKDPFPTCSVRKAVAYVGVDRLRDLIEVGRLGQESRGQDREGFGPEEAYWLARASQNHCSSLTNDADAISAAYVLGMGLRSGAVEPSGTLGQVAKRAAYLMVLLGLPEILGASLMHLAASNASAPFEQWPRLIGDAVVEQSARLQDRGVAA